MSMVLYIPVQALCTTSIQHGFSKQSVPYIHTAWASALLILGGGQCESLSSGMSDEFRFPRFFYVVVCLLTIKIPCRESAERHKKVQK